MSDLLIDQGDGVVWSREKNRGLTAQELIERIAELEARIHEYETAAQMMGVAGRELEHRIAELEGALRRAAYEHCNNCAQIKTCARAGTCLRVETHVPLAGHGRDAVETVIGRCLARSAEGPAVRGGRDGR